MATPMAEPVATARSQAPNATPREPAPRCRASPVGKFVLMAPLEGHANPQPTFVVTKSRNLLAVVAVDEYLDSFDCGINGGRPNRKAMRRSETRRQPNREQPAPLVDRQQFLQDGEAFLRLQMSGSESPHLRTTARPKDAVVDCYCAGFPAWSERNSRSSQR